jgi:L-lactate dehydrogenase complex protein LldG
MIDTRETRSKVLDRIRCSLGTTGDDALNELERGDRERDFEAIPRTYQRAGAMSAAERLLLFEDRVAEYDASVQKVSRGDIAKATGEILQTRSKTKMAVPAGFARDWLPTQCSFEPVEELSAVELNSFDGVITGCTVAIALTGTIVLQGIGNQGARMLSLIPDYHLCIVFADQIVQTVSEAFDRLAATAALPTTFISGPSATSDIEMTRIRGVHGPRMLEILLVVAD